MIDPVTQQPASIVFDGVHKSFGDNHVLRGLDFRVPRGRTTYVIGGSGSGKSVTLKLVVGLMKADAGRVFVDDEDITHMKERKLAAVRDRFGVVFQHGALFDSMDVFDNVAFPLREKTAMPEAEIKDRVLGLLEQVGLKGAHTRWPSDLSGGMRKRVALARALTRDPDYILYDEPTSGLDPVLAASMLELMARTQNAAIDRTTLVISHDMRAVLTIADKVLMLVDGTMRHAVSPEVLRTLDDPYVERFLRGALVPA